MSYFFAGKFLNLQDQYIFSVGRGAYPYIYIKDLTNTNKYAFYYDDIDFYLRGPDDQTIDFYGKLITGFNIHSKTGTFTEPGIVAAQKKAVDVSTKLMALLSEFPQPAVSKAAPASSKNNDDEDEDLPEGSNGPIGINEWSPEARKSSSNAK